MSDSESPEPSQGLSDNPSGPADSDSGPPYQYAEECVGVSVTAGFPELKDKLNTIAHASGMRCTFVSRNSACVDTAVYLVRMCWFLALHPTLVFWACFLACD